MENFKFTIFSILILGAMTGTGYWAFSTIESGSSHVDSQKQKELIQENTDLKKQVIDLKREISLLQIDKDKLTQYVADQEAIVNNVPEVVNPDVTSTPLPTKTVISKNQTLINDLQKMVNNKVYLKLKSQGVYIGTIQKFLNIYNNTSNKVDNDYGTSTVTAVKNFQKAQGLTSDGATGPTTYLKMISWLKSH